MVCQVLRDHFRCPELAVEFVAPAPEQSRAGFFSFGKDTICYGRAAVNLASPASDGPLYDAMEDVRFDASRCFMPVDAWDVVDNLRRERYLSAPSGVTTVRRPNRIPRAIYYGVRPFLPIAIRKHLQRQFFARRSWCDFPRWPVDFSVDQLLENLLATCLKTAQLEEVPFIWFWPDGFTSAAIMTHDVEARSGLRFCSTLMDIDEEFGIAASFQFVPERRYRIPLKLLDETRARNFEINVHDLNHDGRLYLKREEFLRRVERINTYGRQFGARGFRSGALYRNQEWYAALDFEYDMSVPNVARFDPQAGGCCTVMPYFVGSIVELPVTTTQDYSLFHILGDYSLDLWVRQIDLIRNKHGLISFIAHPDYLQDGRSRATYRALLAHLAALRTDAGVWNALPGEVNRWWRARSEMKLVFRNGQWHIEGDEKQRARIAYARLSEKGIHYHFEDKGRGNAAGYKMC